MCACPRVSLLPGSPLPMTRENKEDEKEKQKRKKEETGKEASLPFSSVKVNNLDFLGGCGHCCLQP